MSATSFYTEKSLTPGYQPAAPDTPISEPIVNGSIAELTGPSITFDPEKHLIKDATIEAYSWEDLGYPRDHGVSPIAVCQPFQLFTNEAIQVMRSEILQPTVMGKYRVQSSIAAMQVRGYAEKYAPFIYAAWKHPQTLKLLSKAAGLDLTVRIDHEIGHINFSVKSDKKADEIVADENTGHYSKEREVVGWHYDSYPFCSVTMLSDATGMQGGETVLQLGAGKDGKMLKLRRPQLGEVVVLQGRYVLHKGLTASTGQERISMVTSLWPASPFVRDDSMLTNIRTVSRNDELYVQFAEYRLTLLEERFRAQIKAIRDQRAAGARVTTTELKKSTAMQQEHLKGTDAALLEEDKIERGVVHEVLHSEPVAA